jgi:uncharacterized membrane protein YdjX (TVP38/TMEM64 family)
MTCTIILSHSGYDYYAQVFKIVYKLGFLGQLVFLMLYICGSLIAFPAIVLDLTLGYLYPINTALSICLIGNYTGHLLTYLLGGFIFKGTVLNLLKRSRYLRLFQYALQTQSWKYLFLIRLIYLPAAFKNYGLAAMSAPFLAYMTTAILISGLSIMWHVLLGSKLNSLIEATHSSNLSDGNILLISILVAISTASLVSIAYLTRKVMKQHETTENIEV